MKTRELSMGERHIILNLRNEGKSIKGIAHNMRKLNHFKEQCQGCWKNC